METSLWSTPSGLNTELEEAAFLFDFFRAVRLLENQYSEFPRIGTSTHPHEDPVRFGQNPSLAFAPSTLESFQPGDENSPAKLFVHFLGLYGPNGPMPIHFTQRALSHRNAILAGRRSEAGISSDRDDASPDSQKRPGTPSSTEHRAFLDFCDIFHHRIISLFYRAWALNQKAVDFDRALVNKLKGELRGDNWTGPRFALYVGSCIGLGVEALRERDEVSDYAKLFFAGRLAGQSRNAEGLIAILREYFDVPVQLEPFAGQWIELPKDSKCSLGVDPENCTLGQNMFLGEKVWDAQIKFRIHLGPMKLDDFRRFLPGRRAFRHLVSWVRNYVGIEFLWDVKLTLSAKEVPQTVLGKEGLLGWTTWVRSKEYPTDADDVVLNPDIHHS